MIVGAAGLVALCGPRNITLALAEAWHILAPGRRSSSARLKLMALLLCFALMVPALLITQRSLRRTPRDPPDCHAFELSQNRYVSAATPGLLPALRADRELRSREDTVTR